jgi:SAM-dependent methyltransferase
MNEQKLNNEMEWVKCNLCGSSEFRPFFAGHDYLYFSPVSFALVKCKQCGLVFLNPRPKDLVPYYPPRDKTMEKDPFSFLIPNLAKSAKRFKKGGKILDVGCGYGYFLRDMQREGWEVYGNDLSKTGCDFATNKLGLRNIYNADLLTIDFPNNNFDVITMWHTLEHMKYPREILEKINLILKDDGILIIEAPNFACLQNKLFKENCQSIDLPRHLYQFTPQVLSRLLILTGFKIFKKDFFANPRVNFIALKLSLLRRLGIERPPTEHALDEMAIVSNYRKAKIFWSMSSFVFNMFCFLLSFILIVVNGDICMRVYCRKIKNGEHDTGRKE